MNERLMASLLRSEVKKLSEEKRSLYRFVSEIEDCLAQSADTADHFLSLLVEHAPYELASRHFGLPYTEVARLMDDIEIELTIKMEMRCKRLKLIDCTDYFQQKADKNREGHVFLFIS
ncbi:hypothetical protein [Sporosarcina sp. FSL K6-3457]|uniref:hypothetical protein n=1 Tax=Sporosarcina sp. FSL K6-3457 TaxID=2978204 RepID=UPI0030F9733B